MKTIQRNITRMSGAAAVVLACLAGAAQAEPVLIADARANWQNGVALLGTTADFGSGAGLPDTSGNGHWNYYFQNQANSSLTYLKFGKNGFHPNAYGGEGNPSDQGWSNVSATQLGAWGGPPGAEELAWHPGGTTSNPAGPTLIRWTAGAAQAGTINITGDVRLGSATFLIKVSGVDFFDSVTDGTTFNLTDVPVAAGSHVDFLLYGGPGGASFIKAQIFQVSTGELPPLPPIGLTASPAHQQVNLNWTESAGATSYTVKRSLSDGGPYDTLATDVAVTSYQDSGLSNGVPYYYVVSASNNAGESGDSAQASATPQPVPAPTGLTAQGENQTVNLSWSPTPGAGTYNIKRSLNSGGPYDTVATGIATTSYINTGLTNGTPYYYVVSAVSANGEGPDSAEASATPSLKIADLRADYQEASVGSTTSSFGGGSGLPDTAGTGYWNYYQYVGGTLTLLEAQTVGNAGSMGYGNPTGDPITIGGTALPAVSDSKLFQDNPDVPAGSLAWHGDRPGTDILFRWTSAITGTIDISGVYQSISGRNDQVDFYVSVNGTQVFGVNPVTDGDAKPFSLTNVSIAPGQHVDFRLSSGFGGASLLSAQIFTATSSSDPYDEWAGPSGYNLVGSRDDDDDGDGLSNFEEFAFGLNPTSGASVNPITDLSMLKTAGTFSYTRLASSGLTYTVWASTDLVDWGIEPVAVNEEAGLPDENGVQTVLVELPSIPTAPKYFVRVKAE